MLKAVGCLCYALDMRSGRDKFSPKGRRCIFLSYPSHQKAYRLYDLDAHTSFVSRDVKFLEHIFPYHSSIAVQTPQYIFSSCTLSSLDDTNSLPSSNSYPTHDPISLISPICPISLHPDPVLPAAAFHILQLPLLLRNPQELQKNLLGCKTFSAIYPLLLPLILCPNTQTSTI